jgi:hypothetical protein
VVASGVGSTALGAAGGLRSSTPDPLLESAVQLTYELIHASRVYACLDWCVGVFKTPSGVDTVVVSNEGAGYIPPGVFLPRTMRTLFSDPGLDKAFQARWFAWVNPAEPMLAYAGLRGALDPNVELYALAVSTDQGGSSLPARAAGVRYFEDCSLMLSPIAENAPPPPLDDTRMHRLETVDRAQYARLTDPNIGASQHVSTVWQATDSALRTALAHSSGLLGLSVPPVIRLIHQALGSGQPVTDAQWDDLEMAKIDACLDSAAQRPGRIADGGGASQYARAQHNVARAAEALLMWRGDRPAYPEIIYAIAQILKEAQLWPNPGE